MQYATLTEDGQHVELIASFCSAFNCVDCSSRNVIKSALQQVYSLFFIWHPVDMELHVSSLVPNLQLMIAIEYRQSQWIL